VASDLDFDLDMSHDLDLDLDLSKMINGVPGDSISSYSYVIRNFILIILQYTQNFWWSIWRAVQWSWKKFSSLAKLKRKLDQF